MTDIFFRYAFWLMCGVVLGLISHTYLFPFSLWWLLLIFVVVFVVTELVGQLGFGGHWHDYRLTVYVTHTGPAVFALIGILLGSGKIGILFIKIGTLLSFSH